MTCEWCGTALPEGCRRWCSRTCEAEERHARESEAAFEALSPERKATVIRYALAVVTQGTDPGSGWGPLSVAVGAVAWNEVAAVARGTRKAA